MSKPILKWVGGKTQILDKVLTKFPRVILNYREPFVGGGSVLLGLLDKVVAGEIEIRGKIYACDINDKLIAFYKNVKTYPSEVIENLLELKKEFQSCALDGAVNRKAETKEEAMKNPESYYYYIRSNYNKLSIEEQTSPRGSAILIFLNKTCFRGVYREGPNGFNVPYGNYKNLSFDEEHIRVISKLIQPVEFTCCSFEVSLQNATKGDFIYMDPPYAPENSKSFVAYTRHGFKKEDHNKLFDCCNKLSDCGVLWMMSNSDVPIVRESFSKCTIEQVLCRRAINSKNPESTTNEVFITNY